MPDRTYTLHAGRQPIWRDHLLAHPGEVVLAVWSVIIGAIMLAQVFITGLEPSPSLAALPAWLTISVAATIIGGGTVTTLGLFWPGRASTEWLLERIGWITISAGWLSYAVSILKTFPGSVISISFVLVMVSVAALRLRALSEVEREIRARTCEGAE